MAIAAIDCGTNTTRLLIAENASAASQRQFLESRAEITRLGAGVDKTNKLAPDAIARTLDCLRDYKKLLDQHQVTSLRAVATSATRDAYNRADFLTAATAILGTEMEVLSGQDEAKLSFQGATASLDPATGPFLVLDIGGGSTELSYGTQDQSTAISMDIGSVRLTEQHIANDPPLPEELSAVLSVIGLHLDDATRALGELDPSTQLIGVAGTVTTIAAVEIGLAEYDSDAIHHFNLSKAAAEDVFRNLAVEPLADRIHNPGLDPRRADVIVAGACILVGVMRHFGFSDCLVSESDLLDSLLLDLDPKAPDLLSTQLT